MPLLVRHPDTPPGAIHTVEAELERNPDGVIATFRAIGDVTRLIVPPRAKAAHRDGLWRTTCFELFVGGKATAYREYNFSPSGAWAAYRFDDHRHGMRPVADQIDIKTSSDDKALTVIAAIQSEFPLPASIGLAAVIEEVDGALRYWASAFAPGKPDFHNAAVRSLLLDSVDAS
ncbi:MAG: hypothetical protein M3Q88_07690 [Pseudomonadota bacterium]|nr:hypothetical protein [Pseudomonadota bacterium]